MSGAGEEGESVGNVVVGAISCTFSQLLSGVGIYEGSAGVGNCAFTRVPVLQAL